MLIICWVDLWNGKVKWRIRNNILILFIFLAGSCRQEKTQTSFKLVTPSEGVTLLVQDITCIDLRSQKERLNEGFIASSISIPQQEFTTHKALDTINKNKGILVYNKDGILYDDIMSELTSRNFSNVYLLLGGFNSWKYQELEIVNN